MPKTNWNEVDARDDGAFERLEAGGYVAIITDTEPSKSGQAEKFIVDIAEGPKKDYYKNAQYNIDNAFYLSWATEKALKYTKGRLEKIQASNPGFDPFAAFDADKWEMFLGKLVGIVMRDREFEKNDGTIGTGVEIDQIVTVEDIRSGNFKIPPMRKLEGSGATSSDTTTTTSAYDNPFAQ